jgi:hypothetical protein
VVVPSKVGDPPDVARNRAFFTAKRFLRQGPLPILFLS